MEHHDDYATQLRYIILHHEYSLLAIDESNHSSLEMSSNSMLMQPLLIDVPTDPNQSSDEDWIKECRRNHIIICQRMNGSHIDELKFEYNYIKQGYTTATILNNFT